MVRVEILSLATVFTAKVPPLARHNLKRAEISMFAFSSSSYFGALFSSMFTFKEERRTTGVVHGQLVERDIFFAMLTGNISVFAHRFHVILEKVAHGGVLTSISCIPTRNDNSGAISVVSLQVSNCSLPLTFLGAFQLKAVVNPLCLAINGFNRSISSIFCALRAFIQTFAAKVAINMAILAREGYRKLRDICTYCALVLS